MKNYLIISALFAIPLFAKDTPKPGDGFFLSQYEEQKWIRDMEIHNDSLVKAAASRVLTDKEFDELMDLGYNVFVKNMVSFNEEEMQIRYMRLLETQARIRLYAESLKGCK